MAQKRDLRKAFDQHVELTDYFTGFAVKSAKPASPLPQENQDSDNKTQLAEIAQQAKDCCKCGLGSTRKNSVPGEGNPHARLVFVGEAPGADEDEQGRPFVGRAGQLLDKIIAAMGLKRQDVFICNVLRCRPPDNRDPKPEEIISCMPFLKAQLAAIRPEIIVALGAHAAHTLLKSEKPIGQLRGKFHDFYFDENAEPIKLMPTYHPAYLLRNYSDDNRRRVWEDMKVVVAELGLDVPKK
ncbi:MAG: uracil-DNA glycosylase [Phycisphaerae bacterium]|jgi:DNA polymerase